MAFKTQSRTERLIERINNENISLHLKNQENMLIIQNVRFELEKSRQQSVYIFFVAFLCVYLWTMFCILVVVYKIDFFG